MKKEEEVTPQYNLTLQQWFEGALVRVEEGPLEANNKGVSDPCKYAAVNGIGPCFIGMSIDDDDARRWDENAAALEILMSDLEIGIQGFNPLDLEDFDLVFRALVDLQSIHDAVSPSRWAGFLLRYQQYYGLTWPDWAETPIPVEVPESYAFSGTLDRAIRERFRTSTPQPPQPQKEQEQKADEG